ncbi:MAG: CoA-binding protein [Dehalococcoidia bacterium]
MDAAASLLKDAKTIAVVGLDSRTQREAYRIAVYLQRVGYKVIPVHRGRFPAEEVLGEKAYEKLTDIPEPIDIADLFVRSEETDPVIDDAIAAGAKGVWLQSGIFNDAGIERARAAGLVATQDRCTMVVHRNEIASGSG